MTESEEKRNILTKLLPHGTISVLLDSRRAGVVVPKQYAGRPALVLQFGLDMIIQIPDLDVGEAGITATLSFDHTPFSCFIPWPAVYAFFLDDTNAGVVFRLSQPEDVHLSPKEKTPRKFGVVDGGKEQDSEQPTTSEKQQHLKLVH